ncbi:MAG TPA: nucleotide exchange factor GrpE [Candidatus Paceibacterota bacterium]
MSAKDDHKKKGADEEIVYEDAPDLEAGDDPAAEGPAMATKLAKLREKLSVCESSKAEYLAGWQRAKADLINAGKRHEEERRRFATLGEEAVLHEILPALDAFDMAMANREAWEKVDAGWRQGVEFIRSQLLGTLSRFGVEAFGAPGEHFDAARHHSIENVAAESASQDGTLAAVVQKGYARGDQVIRPAAVKVFHLEQ